MSRLPEMLEYGLSQDAPLDAAITSCTESFVSSQATTHASNGNNLVEFVLDSSSGAFDLRKCYVEADLTLTGSTDTANHANTTLPGTTNALFNRIVVSTLGGTQLAETQDSDIVFASLGYGSYNQSACDAHLSPYLGQRHPRRRIDGNSLATAGTVTPILIGFDPVPFFRMRTAFPCSVLGGLRIQLYMNSSARFKQNGTLTSHTLTNVKLHFTHLQFAPSFRDALQRKFDQDGLQVAYENLKCSKSTAFTGVRAASINLSHSAERCSDVTVVSLADADTNEDFTYQGNKGANSTQYSLRVGAVQYPTSGVTSDAQAFMQYQHVMKAHHTPTEHSAVSFDEFQNNRGAIAIDSASAIDQRTADRGAKSGRYVMTVGLDKDDSAQQTISGIPIVAGSSSFDITDSAVDLGQLVVIMNCSMIASFSGGNVSVIG